ncbi:MAG: MOFRL family protein, partial [Alphaproteobacteria bacterium]
AALGQTFGQQALDILTGNGKIPRPALLIGGGEGTVFLGAGPRGQGGPNQEFAAAAAIPIAGRKGVVVLAMDTDGTDGPTDLAGGLVDGTSCARAAAGGNDLAAALARHDISPALSANNDAIVTGATGTNVNDLKLLLVS